MVATAADMAALPADAMSEATAADLGLADATMAAFNDAMNVAFDAVAQA